MSGMAIVPVTLRAACTFVAEHHRHNKPPRGHKFSVGLRAVGALVGVAIAGWPVARHFDDGLTLEVNRTCTDGSRNANSMLYGAIWRAAKAMGYRRCITYTQADESGASLRAAGFVRVKVFALTMAAGFIATGTYSPAQWHWGVRIMAACCFVVFTLIAFMVYDINKDY